MRFIREDGARWESISKPLRLLVVELGSSAPCIADELETLAIQQMEGEQPMPFVWRVLERVATFERAGARFQSAVVRIGYRSDRASTTARRELARGLVRGAGSSSALELSFCTNVGATEHARGELLRLAEEIESTRRSHATEVSLQFGTASAVLLGRRRTGGKTPTLDHYN